MTSLQEAFSVYIVEDDASVLRSLEALLGSHGYKTISCGSAEAFLETYDPTLKACMVLDLRLPGMGGTKLQAKLADLGIDIPVIILSAHGDIPIAVEAMRAGAIDFIEKPAKADRIIEVVQLAASTLENQGRNEVPRTVVAERLSRLTDREQEVLQHMLNGKFNKEIASDLGISQRTVEVHRARIRMKMQARGIADLVRMLG